MGGFYCPNCEQIRHIEEDSHDPRNDCCWKCGTLVPYTAKELAEFRKVAADDGIWPGLTEPRIDFDKPPIEHGRD